MYFVTRCFHTSCCYVGCTCNFIGIVIEFDEYAYPELTVVKVWMFFSSMEIKLTSVSVISMLSRFARVAFLRRR